MSFVLHPKNGAEC